MNLNEKQIHALKVIDDLIAQEKEKPRIANDSCFIPTFAAKPEWSKMPNEWAEDWCQGWAFDVGTHFAEAFAISLDQFVENKKIIMKWVQRTAFNFRPGYVIHTYGKKYQDLPWGSQVAHNPICFQVKDAKEATPWRHGVKAKPPVKQKPPKNDTPAIPYVPPVKRDSGYVIFHALSRDNNYLPGTTRQLSQDDFIRFLIIGEDFFSTRENHMAEKQLDLIVNGNNGNYHIFIAVEPKPVITCTCPGASTGVVCRHVREILRGDFSNIADLSSDKKETLENMLSEEAMKEIIESQAIQIDWLEQEEERIKKEIKKRKKLLAASLTPK